MGAYRVRGALGCLVGLLGAGLQQPARADETIATPARALPGLARVGAASPMTAPFALAVGTGYGFTGDVLGQNDSHHRTSAAVAASYRPFSWLGVGFGLDGRYDRHGGDGIDDDGWVGDPRIGVRAVRPLGRGLAIGGETTVWLPGNEVPSIVLSALSLDLEGIASYAPDGWNGHSLHANAGLRVDRSASSAPEADRLSRSDRLSLGVSDSNAILLGLGWRWRARPATLFAEWSWDAHVGDGAPGPLESPMRIGAGAHVPIGDGYQVFGLAEVVPSSRPEVGAMQPLVPIEPRARLLVGLSFRPAGAAARTPPPVAEAPGGVTGRVVTADGAGVAGARVTIGGAEGERVVETGPDGAFRATGIPAGPVGVIVTAKDYRERTVAAEIGAGETVELEVEIRSSLPAGEVKGIVQSWSGSPVTASIRIEPVGIDRRAGEDGRFEVELAPGDYTVVVSAPGHRTQRSEIRVERNGVTVLNVDLRAER